MNPREIRIKANYVQGMGVSSPQHPSTFGVGFVRVLVSLWDSSYFRLIAFTYSSLSLVVVSHLLLGLRLFLILIFRFYFIESIFFSCLLEDEQRFGLGVLIGPNMLHILALISFPIALFSYVFVSLMGSMCVIAGNCLFLML